MNCPSCGSGWELTPEEADLNTFTCEECQTTFDIAPGDAETPPPKIPLESVMPQCPSKRIYLLVMASCSYALATLVARIARLFEPPVSLTYKYPLSTDHSIGEGIFSALIFAPIVETIILIGIIEVARLLKLPYIWQLIFSVSTLCAMHTPGFPLKGLIVAPSFIIFAYSYLDWRRKSWKIAIAMVILIHSASNLIPVLDFIIQKHRTG